MGTENDKVPCTVYIMPDRPKTIENLRTHLLQRNCSAVVAPQITDAEVNDKGNKTKEHGPLAGAGFFRDLVVVSQARSAFIGDVRSSSALIDELMEYNRRTEAWHSKRVVDSLDRCYIGNQPRAVAYRMTASEKEAERASASTFGNKVLPAGLVTTDALVARNRSERERPC
jgi:hypothetical protein